MATKPTKHKQTIISRQFSLKRTISRFKKNRSCHIQTQELWRTRRIRYLQTKSAKKTLRNLNSIWNKIPIDSNASGKKKVINVIKSLYFDLITLANRKCNNTSLMGENWIHRIFFFGSWRALFAFFFYQKNGNWFLKFKKWNRRKSNLE